jgi:hypothetical protein
VNEVNYTQRGRRNFEMEIEELQKGSAKLSDSFTQAIELLNKSIVKKEKSSSLASANRAM